MTAVPRPGAADAGGLAVPGPVLLEFRQYCADQVIEPRPTTGALRYWGETGPDNPDPLNTASALVQVTRGVLFHHWEIRLTGGRGTPATLARSGRALTCRGAWIKAGAALPSLTAAQRDEVAAARRDGTGRCGVTAEVPVIAAPAEPRALDALDPDPAPEHTRVFVCEREAGHGGTTHAGPILNPGGPEWEFCSAEWPMETPRPPAPNSRYLRLRDARGPYRVGRKQPHNVYRQIGNEPGDGDVSLFDAGRADLAAEAVAALNARRSPLPPGTGYGALERAAAVAVETEQDRVRDLTAEVARLGEALRVCEIAVHHTAVVGDTEPGGGTGAALLHAAQQASGAYWTDWEPHEEAPPGAPVEPVEPVEAPGDGAHRGG